MKKRIRKFWGIALVVVLLSTLFVGTAPQASAGTLAFTTAGTPSAIFGQVAAANAAIVKVAPNGDICGVDNTPAPDRIFKSTPGGHSWAAAVIGGLAAADVIVDIAISPNYAADGYVYALVNIAAPLVVRVYQSSNFGATFLQLGGNVGGGGTEVGSSIALDPTFGAGVGQIAVGTYDGGATVAGDVYIWGAPALTWTASLLAQDVTAVA